jgi:hypothetical protein
VDADGRGRYPDNVATAAVPRMNPGSDVGTGRKRLQGACCKIEAMGVVAAEVDE